MANLNEAAVEAAALEWFAQLGYAVSGPWKARPLQSQRDEGRRKKFCAGGRRFLAS